jgi:hypothetical protein
MDKYTSQVSVGKILNLMFKWVNTSGENYSISPYFIIILEVFLKILKIFKNHLNRQF